MHAASQDVSEQDSFYLLAPAEVRAIRASVTAPFSKTNLSKKEISRLNLGQDIPFLLNHTPSVVVSADAGNGIGYTGIRIRGTDATRINVTLNGIPYNDAESQGTFFVNLPDFSSSVNSIQIQRGAGTSSNGSGSFGASINMSTNEVNKTSYAEFNNSGGSFNTLKNTIKAGTGLLNEHFTVDARLSSIGSSGYIDRATSNLQAAYISAAYLGEITSLRFNLFTGEEKTYQAWNGIPEADLLNNNRTVNYSGSEKPGEPYDNETDNYTQSHYQLFFTHQFKPQLSFTTAFFLTRGKGYYEQYKAGRDYAEFSLPDPSPAIESSDFVRQLWLDNYYYGNTFSLDYIKNKTKILIGGAVTKYDGDHYGKLIWALDGGIPEPAYKWYDHDARKIDFNLYGKWQEQLSIRWSLFGDLQFRAVNYRINGFRDNPTLRIHNNYSFFNPKAGISYRDNTWNAYFSYGAATKEPNRDDFEAGTSQQPRPEKLHDFEAGIETRQKNHYLSASLYHMQYIDQLVLTGKINDVGAYTRMNIPVSFRQGIEFQGGVRMNSKINFSANMAFSRNKIKDFTEYVDDYDNGGQKLNYFGSTTIAFSPAVVGSASLELKPIKNTEINFTGKYVSRQYLDNTENDTRALNPFFVQDVRVLYTFKIKGVKEISLVAQFNNVFSNAYEPNGYTFSYIAGGETATENFYFPMAGFNFLGGISIRL